MDKNRIISIVLVVMVFVFVGLAVNEFYQYRKSNETYEEAREDYYSNNERPPVSDEVDETPETVEAPNAVTGSDIVTDNTSESAAEVVTDTTIAEDNPVDNEQPESTPETPMETPAQTPAQTPENQEEKAAVAEAGGVIGWVSIPGTGIDYPVVQTSDNEFYLTHNYLGNKDVKGAIYMDFRNDDIGDDRNYILYGHKMIDGSMFSDLVYYVQDGSYKRYFYNYNTVKYDDYEEETEWKIFSAYVVDLNKEDYYLYTNYSDDEKYQAFIDRAYKRSILDSDIEVTLEDEIMTLVTCSFWYKNSRVILHAVRQ